MKQDEAVKAIYQRWMAQWPGLSGAVAFAFDNDAIDQATTFARVMVDAPIDEQQQTLGAPGARKFLVSGIVTVEVTTPGNAGTVRGYQLADYVRQIYQAQRFGAAGTEEGVMMFATTVTPTRSRATAKDSVLSCETPFQFIDVR